MNYYKNMYVGTSIKDLDHIISLLKENIAVYDVYLICIKKENNNLLTIIHSIEVFKVINNMCSCTIIGIANSKKEAFLLTKKIIEDFYVTNNDFKFFKEYFLNNK